MKFKTGEKIIIAIALIIGVIVSISIWKNNPIDNNNTTYITGHFDMIKANRPARGSLNYDLYITEDENFYKIGANYTNCFNYDYFIKQVKRGDLVKIGIKSYHSLIESSNVRLIISLSAGSDDYVELDCINNEIQDQKIFIPIISFAFMIIGFIIYKYKTKEKKLKKSISS